MTYALDTNIISYILQKQIEVVDRLKTELNKGNHVVIPPIVYYEVRRGLLASNSTRKAETFEILFADLNIDVIDRETLEIAAIEYARLRRIGLTVGDADLFIAEYCVKNDFTLVTNNTKHFQAIQGLRYTNWLTSRQLLMNLTRFNADDIHELRVQMYERWRNMSSEEAEKDFQQKAENTRRAIEEIRKQKFQR